MLAFWFFFVVCLGVLSNVGSCNFDGFSVFLLFVVLFLGTLKDLFTTSASM